MILTEAASRMTSLPNVIELNLNVSKQVTIVGKKNSTNFIFLYLCRNSLYKVDTSIKADITVITFYTEEVRF